MKPESEHSPDDPGLENVRQLIEFKLYLDDGEVAPSTDPDPSSYESPMTTRVVVDSSHTLHFHDVVVMTENLWRDATLAAAAARSRVRAFQDPVQQTAKRCLVSVNP